MASEKIDIKTFLQTMDIATALRQQREEAGKQLDFDEQKADLRERILKVSEETGEQLRPEEVNVAIDSFMEGLYSFKGPKKGIGTTLGHAYVNRGKVAKYSLLTIGVIAAAVIGFTSIDNIKEARAIAAEKTEQKRVYEAKQAEETKLNNFELSVENSIERGYGLKIRLAESFKQLSKAKSPNRTENGLDEVIANFGPSLNQTEYFFTEFCSDGDADDEITRANMNDANEEFKIIKQKLNEAENKISLGQTILQAEAQYFAAKSIAKEDKAKSQAEIIYNHCKNAGKTNNAALLESNKNELVNLENILRPDLTYRIVTKSGVKSGIDRYYTDKNGKRSSGFYLILEAIDSNDRTHTMSIKNEENGSTYDKQMWGERVPEYIYEKVKQDKINDGIIQNKLYAKKSTGYITPQVIMTGQNGRPLEREGQITSW
ncbi:MAG: DUF6384 family protein [archaeon]